jgi:hypothetical protein
VHPYRIAGFVLGTLALFFIGFLVVGLLLPSGWDAERSIAVNAPPEEIFPLVARSDGWQSWTTVPDEGMETFGPDEGEGSGYRWDDPAYGQGEFLITSAVPLTGMTYEVQVEGGAIRIEGRIALTPEANETTTVHWREEGDFGWNPLLGYLASRMSELQGAEMEASLATLRSLAEGAEVRAGPD